MFLVYCLSEILNLCVLVFNLQVAIPKTIAVFGNLALYLAFLVVFIHTYSTRGLKKSVVVLVVGFLAGFFSEYFGTIYGWVFGAYYYTGSMRSLLGLMSMDTPFSWANAV